MKAAILTGIREMELRDIPEPGAPAEGEVKLRINVVGVCGSDLHYYRTGRIGDQVVSFPFLLGHECSATVVETGPGVEELSVGDRVAVDPLVWCLECDQCKAGRVHTCRNQKFLGCPGQLEGCLAEYINMPARSCFKTPDGMDMVTAALVEPYSIGLYAQRLAREDLTDQVVAIFGAGPIGLSILLAAKAAGAKKIYATDIREYRKVKAGEMGADWTGNPERSDVVADILAQEPEGVDIAFEAAGEQDTLDQGVEILRPGGKLMMVGIPESDRVSFEIAHVRRKEVAIQPVRRQNHCVRAAIDMTADGTVDLGPMVTHEMPLDDVLRAFDLVDDYKDNVIKAMIHVAE